MVLASANATSNATLLRDVVAHGIALVMIDRDDHPQVRCHRVLTDDVSFGWVADVFVVDEHRARGVGVFLMECIVEAYEHLPRLVLGTRDAHGVYAKVGFQPLIRVERWMERWNRTPNP